MPSNNTNDMKTSKQQSLAETVGEEKKTLEGELEHELSSEKEKKEGTDNKEVYHVYILQRVVQETKRICKLADPKEALGILLGYKYTYKGKRYVKVVDWVTGHAYQSHAYAEFTPKGVQQYTSIIQEKYGDCETRPRIVGIFHSHPFGTNPSFSSTDYGTFLNFPYDAEYNVFVLIDPRAKYYKSYIVVKDDEGRKGLQEVDWVEYTVK
ncbi:MAG: Mov34/MPN/PAD-1 family protein [Candidatus Heimdallarchaeota archaeon]|nr:Mov34/MPN/PAD-1 family protein [Candidatus Heimdallarchaeota archaeon]